MEVQGGRLGIREFHYCPNAFRLALADSCHLANVSACLPYWQVKKDLRFFFAIPHFVIETILDGMSL